MTNEQAGKPSPRRHSEKRQRTKTTALRWLQDEFNLASERAREAGLSFGAYVRATATGDAGPRAQRRLPVDDEKMRRVLALHNKYGNNMNQIAYQLNAYGMKVLEADFRTALKEWEKIRDATLDLLGRMHTPEEPPKAAPKGFRSSFLPPGGGTNPKG